MTKIGLKDQIKIQLKYFDDSIIAEIPNDSHTWQVTGLKAIRNATCAENKIEIDNMRLYCSEGNYTADNLTKSQSGVVAIFEGSWSTTTGMSNIGTLQIERGGTIYSRITPTLFDKDTSTALVVNWRSTITGDWLSDSNRGRWLIANRLVNDASYPYVNTISSMDGEGYFQYATSSYTWEGDTIAVWCATFTGTFYGTGLGRLFLRSDALYISSHTLSPHVLIPADIDLGVKWRSTFSAG